MQDDEQGLDAAIDDKEGAARLHFWVAPNGKQEMAQRLNSPLRIFSASATATLCSVRALLSPLRGSELLHAVAISARSVGLVFAEHTDECVADQPILAKLSQLHPHCQSTASDALFSPIAASECRRHLAAYLVECN